MAKKDKVSKGMIGVDKSWQAEDDARTLMRAEEVRGDKARFRAAVAWAKERAAELQKLAPSK